MKKGAPPGLAHLLGHRIYFGRGRGEQTLGEIVKVNPKTYKVRQLEARGTSVSHGIGTIWTVPHRMASPVSDVAAPRPVPVRAPVRTPARTSRQRGQVRVINGVDIDRAVTEFRKLPVFREYPIPTPLRVDVSVYAHRPTRFRGTAFYKSGRIRIMAGRETSPARILEVVLHELVHMAVPGHGHDELFRKVFARAVREAWVLEIPIDLRSAHRGHLRAYAMGDYLVGKLLGEEPTKLYGYSATAKAPRARSKPLSSVELPPGFRVKQPSTLADTHRPREIEAEVLTEIRGRPKPKLVRKPKPAPAKKPKRPRPRKPGEIITADELLARALEKLK